VSAGVIEEVSLSFYRELLSTNDLTRSFDVASNSHPFTLFLAERMLATTYGRVLKMQSIGKARTRRVDELVSVAIANGAKPEKIQDIRVQARLFSRPDVERFEAVQRRFLPGGIGFTFEQLVDFLRAGPNGHRILPNAART